MPKKVWSLVSSLFVVALVLAACSSQTTALQELPATGAPVETEAMIGEPVATEEPAEVPTGEPEEALTEVPATTPAENAGVSGTIVLWHPWNENEMMSLKEVIEAFQEKNPDVQFDVLYVPFDDLRGKFETAAAAGGGPTVLIGAADWGPAFYDAQLIADMTEFASDELIGSINTAALGAVQHRGALVGLPQTIEGVVMFRNPSIVPEAPATFEDLLAGAQAASQGDVAGAFLETGFFFTAAHLNGVGGQLMDEDGDPLFNSEAGVEWLNLLLAVRGAGIPVENYTDNDINLFKAGKAGIVVDVSWNLASLVEAVGEENVVIDPWPTPLSGYVQTENIYLSANATDEDAQAGWAFIEYFLSPEAQAILADPAMAAHLPAVSGVKVTDAHQQQLLEAFTRGTVLPVIPEMNAYWNPLNNLIKAVLEQGADPAAALAQAEEEVNARIAEIRGGG